MKKFVIVFTWLHLGHYPVSSVYSVKARNKASAVKKASTFAEKKVSLSTFEIFAEEITLEKQLAISGLWQKLFRECDTWTAPKATFDAFHIITEFWRATCCNREDYTI